MSEILNLVGEGFKKLLPSGIRSFPSLLSHFERVYDAVKGGIEERAAATAR